MKTFLAKPGLLTPKWYVVDAKGETLGRLAVRIANVLRGRHRPTYTPHVDTGDYVIVINASQVAVSGKKGERKTYMTYTGFRGNEYYQTFNELRASNPEKLLHLAVRRMLPKNRLAVDMMKKLRVFGGAEHPHAAQTPEKFPF